MPAMIGWKCGSGWAIPTYMKQSLRLIQYKPNFIIEGCLMSYHLILSESRFVFTTFFPCDAMMMQSLLTS